MLQVFPKRAKYPEPSIYKKDNGSTGNTDKQQQALPGHQWYNGHAVQAINKQRQKPQ